MSKILVVDDEEMMRMIARRILSKDYEVILAGSGAEAIEIYDKERPELILSDLLMPGMNGFEMHKILQDKYRENVHIMYMTADGAEETEGQGFDLGAEDFIRKPFRPDVLLKRVQNIMDNLKQISSLTEEATIDKLTGLLNKGSSAKALSEACARENGALLMVDLDSFKLVNDMYGHDMGDQVLKGFAGILTSNTEPQDIRCRIGGDEFSLFIKGVTDEKVLKDMSERVNRQILDMARSLMGEEMQIPLGASFGVAFVPQQGRNYDELTRKADRALYLVKKNGKHGIAFFREELAKIETQSEASIDELRRIRQVLEERNITNSALRLDKEAFTVAYRFMLRYIKTYRTVAYTSLVTLTKKDESTSDIDFAEMTEEFGNVIDHALRKSDIMMRSRMNQYFLLLPELEDEFAESVFARIRNNWKKTPYYEKTLIRFDAEKIASKENPVEDRRR
ncbi:MAG: diguanylate cyclase [Eubacterium sp.]|nr:diguanylate cyclase [Eubacterium sp.]